MESRRAAAFLSEETRVEILSQRRVGTPISDVHGPMEAIAPASQKRQADVATPPAQCDAADLQVAVPDTASLDLFVSDAVMEPLYAAARDRRASYLRAGFPIVSVVVFGALLCVAWLL